MPAPNSKKRVTIKDVASEAGVSWMTVSRALHTPELVAVKTRKLVEQTAQKLNYIPDLAAGSLARSRSNLIAVILPSLYFEGHIRTIEGLSAVMRREGFHLLMGDDYYSHNEEMELLRMILGRRPAGIVVINSAHSQEGRKLLMRSDVPVVETWHLPQNPIDSVIGFSHANVGFAMTQHLISEGYRNIAFVASPAKIDPRSKERHSGYVKALNDHGLDASRLITITNNPLSITAGKDSVEQLVERYPDTDAMICLTDRVAMGAMMECRRRGINVPSDLAIAGHGDFEFSEHLVPSLTTTRIDALDIGTQTAELLLKRIAGTDIQPTDKTIDVGFSIVARESSQSR